MTRLAGACRPTCGEPTDLAVCLGSVGTGPSRLSERMHTSVSSLRAHRAKRTPGSPVRKWIRASYGYADGPGGCAAAVALLARKGSLINPVENRPTAISRVPRTPWGVIWKSWLLLFRRQGSAFVMIGVINTLIGFCFFIGLELILGPHAGYLVVLLLAHVASVACAFVLYRRMVFRVRGHVWRDLVRFESVYLTALATNFALLPILVEIGGVAVIIAQSVIVVFGAAISFFGHKHFSFRRPPIAG